MQSKFENWNYVYKYDPKTFGVIETNLVYTPLTNEDKTKFCMLFDHTTYYQNEMLHSWLPERPSYTKEMVKFFFDREVKYLNIFKEYSWCPKIYEINEEEQYIILEWAGETCNTIVYENRNLSDYCYDWQDQLELIIKEIYDLGYYKVTLYPHCFFIKDQKLKAFDFYGCIEKDYPFLNLKDVKGMLGGRSVFRFTEATEEEQINLEIFAKKGMEQYIYWPDEALNTIYKKIF